MLASLKISGDGPWFTPAGIRYRTAFKVSLELFSGTGRTIFFGCLALSVFSFSVSTVRFRVGSRVSWSAYWLPRLLRSLPAFIFSRIIDRKSVVEGKSVDLGGRRVI